MRTLAIIITAGLIIAGCESDFNPKGEFRDRVVVYAVLSPESTVQYARVFTTYDPPGFNPLESTSSNQIANATITITSGASQFMFRETTFARTDLSRYQDSIHAYVASPVNVVRGNTYTLNVSAAPYGSVSATMTVPEPGVIDIDNSSIPSLTNPGAFHSDISIFASPSEDGQGHVIQMFLEYEIATNPGVYLREEVPAGISNYKDCVTFDAAYPQIRRRQTGSGRELWSISHLNYRRTILKILKEHEGQVVNFTRVVVIMKQADQNLYSYLSLVNGFRDELTIRVDRPNFTNIQGGLGLFGSFASDSVSVNVGPVFNGLSCTQ